MLTTLILASFIYHAVRPYTHAYTTHTHTQTGFHYPSHPPTSCRDEWSLSPSPRTQVLLRLQETHRRRLQTERLAGPGVAH